MNDNKIMTVCEEIGDTLLAGFPTEAARKFIRARRRFPVLTDVALLTQVGSAIAPLVEPECIDKHKATLAAHVRILAMEVA